MMQSMLLFMEYIYIYIRVKYYTTKEVIVIKSPFPGMSTVVPVCFVNQ